jgi:hypothetical protein
MKAEENHTNGNKLLIQTAITEIKVVRTPGNNTQRRSTLDRKIYASIPHRAIRCAPIQMDRMKIRPMHIHLIGSPGFVNTVMLINTKTISFVRGSTTVFSWMY